MIICYLPPIKGTRKLRWFWNFGLVYGRMSTYLQKENYRGVTHTMVKVSDVALMFKKKSDRKIAKTYVRCIKGVIILPTPRVIIAGIIIRGYYLNRGHYMTPRQTLQTMRLITREIPQNYLHVHQFLSTQSVIQWPLYQLNPNFSFFYSEGHVLTSTPITNSTSSSHPNHQTKNKKTTKT